MLKMVRIRMNMNLTGTQSLLIAELSHIISLTAMCLWYGCHEDEGLRGPNHDQVITPMPNLPLLQLVQWAMGAMNSTCTHLGP